MNTLTDDIISLRQKYSNNLKEYIEQQAEELQIFLENNVIGKKMVYVIPPHSSILQDKVITEVYVCVDGDCYFQIYFNGVRVTYLSDYKFI